MNTAVSLRVAGTFEANVAPTEAGWIGESKEKGTPFVRIPLIVSEGSEIGKYAVWYGYLSDAAFERTIEVLVKAFGFNGDLEGLYSGKISFVGDPCQIVTELESYQGKERCKVRWLNPPGGGPVQKMDENKVRTLIGQLQRKSVALAKNIRATATVPAPASAMPKETVADDDVPF